MNVALSKASTRVDTGIVRMAFRLATSGIQIFNQPSFRESRRKACYLMSIHEHPRSWDLSRMNPVHRETLAKIGAIGRANSIRIAILHHEIGFLTIGQFSPGSDSATPTNRQWRVRWKYSAARIAWLQLLREFPSLAQKLAYAFVFGQRWGGVLTVLPAGATRIL